MSGLESKERKSMENKNKNKTKTTATTKKKNKEKEREKKEKRQKINLGTKKITPWRMKGTIFERYENQKKGGMRKETKPCKRKQK